MLQKKKIFVIAVAISTAMAVNGQETREYSWENLVWAHIYHNQETIILNDYIDELMEVFRPTVWKKYKNDEFELEEKRQESRELFEKRLASYDQRSTYKINTVWSLGQYDFGKEAFPIEGLTPSSYYSTGAHRFYKFPLTYKVFFSNTALVGDCPMAKDAASAFTKRRKSGDGSVNRKVNVSLRFVIEDVEGSFDPFSQVTATAKLLEVSVHDENGLELVSFSSQ